MCVSFQCCSGASCEASFGRSHPIAGVASSYPHSLAAEGLCSLLFLDLVQQGRTLLQFVEISPVSTGLHPGDLTQYAQSEPAPGPKGRWFQIGARHAIFQAWTRPRLKSSRAYRAGLFRRLSVRLSDEVTISAERCPLRSAEFPVALLLQSQNRITELQLDWLGRLVSTAPVDVW